MAYTVLNIFIVILALLVIIFLTLTIYSSVQVRNCQNKESIFCLQWVCSNGSPAVRYNNGQILESGPYGAIASKRTNLSKKDFCQEN